MQSETRTTCPYCGVGCGVIATVEEDGRVGVRGDPDHPANRGRLCSKGTALGQTLGREGRALQPEIDGRPAGWGEALDTVAARLRQVMATHGPDAVAFYVSGQLLTEDYYVANKLMKGFIGSGNIDTNSRLCMSSAVAGHKRAFGEDAVPCSYEDLEQADLVVLAGTNLAWCHPVLFQRLQAARRARPGLGVVVIDPRRTETAAAADLHLALRPGSDAWLFNGLLDHLRREDCLDLAFLERHAEGFAGALAAARASAPSLPEVAAACGLDEAEVATFYRWFARTGRTVTLFSQGINQSSSGTDKVNSIINCHLATGRIGRPGCGPFSITGQPNAMGGREVGGLANQLAGHMELDDAVARERVMRFWQAANPARGPGLKAVDLFRAVESGRVRAVWIMATNPAVTLPDADRVRAALRRCELVIVSDCERHTETTACAHILLPAAAWGEKEGTVTNSERRISRQRAFLDPPGEARPDWWIVAQVGARLGHAAAFDYRSPAEVFREHAALSAFENGGERLFDLGALQHLGEAEYAALEPVQWPVPASAPGGTARLFGEGRFPTATGRARLVAVRPRPPVHRPDGAAPLVLNTGRVRDHWHTLTRTARAPRLTGHSPEPYVQIHPRDAAAAGVEEGGLARLRSCWGTALLRVSVSPEQRPGAVFAPMHWSAPYASAGRVDALVNPVTDPISGQPEFKHTPVRVEPWVPAWQAFVLARERSAEMEAAYRVVVPGDGYVRYELAGSEPVADWTAHVRAWLGGGGEWMEFEDQGAGHYRGALIRAGRLEACLFVSRDGRLPPRTWLAGLMALECLDEESYRGLLTGRPGAGQADAGPVVCACHGVGRETILAAVRGQGLDSVDAIGTVLRAGTQCGSCRPALQALLESEGVRRRAG